MPDHLLRHDFQVSDLAIDLAQETAGILNYGIRNISSTEVSNEEQPLLQLFPTSLKETTRDSDHGFPPSSSSSSCPNPSAAASASASSSSSSSDLHQHQQQQRQQSSCSEKQPLSKSVAVMASELVHQVSDGFLKLLPMQVPSFSRTASSSSSSSAAAAALESPSTAAATASSSAKTKGGLASENPPVSQQIDRSISGGGGGGGAPPPSSGYPASPPAPLHSSCSLGNLVGLAAGLASPASMSLLAAAAAGININYTYGAMLANADANYHWLDRPPLGNTTPLLLLLLHTSRSIIHPSITIIYHVLTTNG